MIQQTLFAANNFYMETPTTNRTIRWAILGPGRIAHKFASDLLQVPQSELWAVASRDLAKALEFASTYHAPRAFGSYLSMLEDPDIDAVYVATPHALHYEHTLMCLEHRKAVLCEKPFAMNTGQVNTMIATAQSQGILLMEALWTAFLPHFQAAVKLIREGAIGEIIGLEAAFGFQPDFDPQSRVFARNMGGGSLLDIGIYPIFAAHAFLGMPEKIQSSATFFENGVDSSCQMTLQYPDGVSARLYSTFLENIPIQATIQGSKGKMIIHAPFHAPSGFTIDHTNGEVEHFTFAGSAHGYNYEIAHFNNLIREGKTQSEVMSFLRSRQIMEILDGVREKIGLNY